MEVGGTWPPEKNIQPETGIGQGVLACCQDFSQDFTQVLVTLSGFHAQTTPKTLDLGQTKAGDGFGTLKIRGWGGVVDTPVTRQLAVGWGWVQVIQGPSCPPNQPN